MSYLHTSTSPTLDLLSPLDIGEPYRAIIRTIFEKTNNVDIRTIGILLGIGIHILNEKQRSISVGEIFNELDKISVEHFIWKIQSPELKNLLGFFLSDPRRDSYWAKQISNMIPYLESELRNVRETADF